MHNLNWRYFVLAVVILVFSAAATRAQTPYTSAEMKTMLAKGMQVSSSDLKGGSEFTGRITLAANGALSGTVTPAGESPIAVRGGWTLKGAQLCRTLAPLQPEEICETWLKSGANQATVVVGGKPASLNRW